MNANTGFSDLRKELRGLVKRFRKGDKTAQLKLQELLANPQYEKGRSDVISTYEAYQTVRQFGEVEGLKRLRNSALSQSGKPLVMRLMNNDMVRMKLDDKEKMMRVIKMGLSGQIFFADHNEANVNARNADNENPFKYVSKMAGSLQAANGRRITISEIGELHDPGFKS